jgi:phosphate uptake regulator
VCGLLQEAIRHLERAGDAMTAMVNRVLEIDEKGRTTTAALSR